MFLRFIQELKKIKLDAIQAAHRRLCQYPSSSLSLHCEIAKRLVDHLEGISIEPRMILDLGGGGASGLWMLLKERFPKAMIISVDVITSTANSQKKSWFKKQTTANICGDPRALPLQDGTIDLVVSNLFLYCFNQWPDLFLEIRRILKPNGLCLFSSLGPDTLRELAPVSENKKIIFSDMHDIGDELVRAKFINPVMDMETLQFSYRSDPAMEQDLKCWQFQSWLPLNFVDNARTDQLSFEIIYGHAWGPSLATKSLLTKEGDIAVPIHQIPLRAKKR